MARGNQLDDKQRAQLARMYASNEYEVSAIARRFGIDRSAVAKIAKREAANAPAR